MTGTWGITAGRVKGSSLAEPWMAPFDQAAEDWLAGRPSSFTSGSTGAPVVHRFTREAVLASAMATARHFGLHGPVSTWSALPAHGTGGRMAVWRALALGWDLTVSPPSSTPEVPEPEAGRYDFGVATPMQAQHLLDSSQLARFHQLLLGGAPLDPMLEAALFEEGLRGDCRIHIGFGMTETLTHIATRPLGSDGFRLLEGVGLTIGADGALTIDAPDRGVRHWATRDAGEWVDGADPPCFRWLGRLDDVINSGGIKAHPHVLERALASGLSTLLGGRRWYIAGRPDAALGQRVTLCLEGDQDAPLERAVLEACRDLGPLRPREVEFIPAFRETPTGKVIRN